MPESQFDVNFFKPRAEHARTNMKVVTSMLVLWAVAVFGFQVLLIFTCKPKSEDALAAFEASWPKVQDQTATREETQAFARATLMVLGKNIILKDADRAVLKNALSAAVKGLDPEAAASDAAAEAIGLGADGFDPLLKDILASSLVPVESARVGAEDQQALPRIMSFYLTHNRSDLTDTTFLGFPFHYWYTAQFLLILFVGLCWLFCFLTDRLNRKHNLETE